MALNQVTLYLDVYNGAGALIQAGLAYLTPSVPLTAPADHVYVWQAPVAVSLEPPSGAAPTWLPSALLYACDNTDFTQTGWKWEIAFQAPGAPPGFSFALNFANGASQYLDSLV